MADAKRQQESQSPASEASQELTAEQLDEVAGGIIIHARLSPPPDPDRSASSLLKNIATKIQPPPEPD